LAALLSLALLVVLFSGPVFMGAQPTSAPVAPLARSVTSGLSNQSSQSAQIEASSTPSPSVLVRGLWWTWFTLFQVRGP